MANEFLVPYIEIGGVVMLEPFTVLTDLLISSVCFFAFFKLRKHKFKTRVHFYLRGFFLLMGVATAIGGILGHGFVYIYGPEAKIPGWYVSMISVAMFERAAIMHAHVHLRKKAGDFFAVVNIIELMTFMTLAYITIKFLFVEIHAVYGLFVVVFFFELFIYLKTKDKAIIYLFIGTGLAAASAISHAMRISVNEWFNHNDVSHVGMAMGIYFYYLFAKETKVVLRN